MTSDWQRSDRCAHDEAPPVRAHGWIPDRRFGWLCLTLLAGGCASHKPMIPDPPRPDVAPTSAPVPTAVLQLDSSQVKPMYSEMVAIDLPAVVHTAVMDNLAIKRARQAVKASRGRYESAVGGLFPALVPTALFEHVEGTVRATEGNLVGVGFNTFQPSIALQWVLNPGRVINDIIASKKRLSASGHREKAVILETLRRAVVQYYDLVLAQARITAAHQGVMEAEELLRINRLRTRTGMGVLADELRAEARLAQRRQELILSMKEFYDASVALAVTLHLDSSLTLVPKITELPPIDLVRPDFPIDELLGIAVAFRPDLEQVRILLEAVTADKKATWWGAYGPQFQAAYQYGGITGNANNVVGGDGIPNNLIVNPGRANGSFGASALGNGLIRESLQRASRRLDGRDNQTFSFSDQIRASTSVGWRLSVSAFGDMKAAKALEEQARIDALSKLDQVKADVVSAVQASNANHMLISLAQQQIAAAAEALRLSEANLRAGMMTTLEVLQSQDAVMQARLRHAEAVVRYNQSQVNLLAALGLLDERLLAPASTDADGTSENP